MKRYQSHASAAVTFAITCLLTLSALLPLAAKPIPVDLPPPNPDDHGTKDKPVKVYILSGQSNMLGFGRVQGAAPFYSKVFLSADPSAIDCKLPADNAALMRLGVFQSAAPDAAGGATAQVFSGAPGKTTSPISESIFPLGSVTADLPKIDGPHTVVTKSFLEVPRTGKFELHVGMGESSHASAILDGVEVYRKEPGGKAVITKIALAKGQRYPLEITYFQGGSAALWMEMVDLKGLGDLRNIVADRGRFPCMIDENGEWAVRHDVMLNDAYMGKGKSDPLSARATGPTFGPELGFGFVMGEFHDEPVIVMKADIGNRSLGWDILPPGSESYTFDGKNYPGYRELLDADGNVQKWTGDGWYAGKQYDDYTAAIRAVLDNFDQKYPQYADQGFEVAGFVWWQGHKDGPNPAHNARYEQNLVNLIKAWRKEFNAPNAKWAIATVGFEGKDMPDYYVKIAEAQMAVADPNRYPEFAGTVKAIDTRPFWRSPEVSPKNQNYHYHHNAETYMLTGDALGRAMIELHGGETEYPSPEMDPSIDPIPMMEIPQAKNLEALCPVLQPIIFDKLVPDYIAASPGTPAYRRNGIELSQIIQKTKPEKRSATLTSQLDQVISYYRLGGIEDYTWTPSEPQMRLAEWQYHTFDPAEKKEDPTGDRYRPITLPPGMESWFLPEFDALQAGWKSGQAPFGQNNGELKPIRNNCGNPQCHCDVTPNTSWEKEVLLIRQSFEIPKFDENKRYRIVIGGAGHAWSGEGFALYLNGSEIVEMTGGYYKGGGASRGVFIDKELQSEIEGKKVTIAVKSFLRQNGHRNKPAPPSGHLSVWIEEALLPPSLLGAR